MRTEGYRYINTVDFANIGCKVKRWITIDPNKITMLAIHILDRYPIYANADEFNIQDLVDLGQKLFISTYKVYKDALYLKRRWQRERNAMPVDVLGRSSAPSLDTTKHTSLEANLTLGLSAQKQTLKSLRDSWKQESRTYRRQAVEAVLKEIVDVLVGSYKKDEVVVFFGSWTNDTGVRGSLSPPLKKFKKLLKKRAKVLPVDESFSSSPCYKCGTKMCNAQFDKENKLVNVGGKKSWRVLRCPKCNFIVNRDVNGILHILRLALCKILGISRPNQLKAFSFKTTAEDEKILEDIRNLMGECSFHWRDLISRITTRNCIISSCS